MDIGFLGTWGLAVLLASMTGAQAVKKALKKRGIENDYIFICLPGIFAAVGIMAMAIGDLLPWKMVPIYVFVIGLGGNVFYKAWKAQS